MDNLGVRQEGRKKRVIFHTTPRMRQISLRCLQRRPASQRPFSLSSRCRYRSQEVQTRQQGTPTSILESKTSWQKSTGTRFACIFSISAKTEFKRVVSRIHSTATTTQPMGPTTIVCYSGTTIAKGPRDAGGCVNGIPGSIDLSIFCPKYLTKSVNVRIQRCDCHQQGDRQTRHHYPKWRPISAFVSPRYFLWD